MFSQKINTIMIKLTPDHMTANVEGKERKGRKTACQDNTRCLIHP